MRRAFVNDSTDKFPSPKPRFSGNAEYGTAALDTKEGSFIQLKASKESFLVILTGAAAFEIRFSCDFEDDDDDDYDDDDDDDDEVEKMMQMKRKRRTTSLAQHP